MSRTSACSLPLIRRVVYSVGVYNPSTPGEKGDVPEYSWRRETGGWREAFIIPLHGKLLRMLQDASCIAPCMIAFIIIAEMQTKDRGYQEETIPSHTYGGRTLSGDVLSPTRVLVVWMVLKSTSRAVLRSE